ncbi:hypothetical protein [Bacillus sp. XF8]|nr:hypothetical protein [Bacillus sp. XF8]MBO1578900.1 hypothetical protein [Bacillus sp. XF8]
MVVHRSGQDLFPPHAMFKPKGENECKSCCILHSSDLDVEQLKWIYKEKI